MRRSRIFHLLFDVGVIGKGVDGMLETIGGIVLFFVAPVQIHQLGCPRTNGSVKGM